MLAQSIFSSSQKLFCLLCLPMFGWGLLLHIFEQYPTFSHVLQFLISAGQGLLEFGLPLHLVHMLLLLLVVGFSFGFRKVFLKLDSFFLHLQ